MSASMCESPPSLLAPDTPCRSRYREACSGFTGYTVYPAAIRAATHGPRSVSIPTAIVNYHHRLPMTQAFGTGTLSSSDGQKFPVKGKSLTAAQSWRYVTVLPPVLLSARISLNHR